MARQLSQITSTLTTDELLAFTSEFHIPEGLHPEVPAHDATIADFPEGKNDRFFWLDDVVMPFEANWYTRENLVKDGRPGTDEYVVVDADLLQDNPLPTGRLPEVFLSMMGISPHHTHGDDMMTLCTYADRRLRLEAKMRIPDLIQARTIRMVLRVDPELAETPSVLNSELRNSASPHREVTGERNAGTGSSAFVPRLSEGEDEEEDLPLDRKRKRSVVGELCHHARCTSIMGSPTRVFTSEWNVLEDTLLTVPEVCVNFLDNITPPGRGLYVEQLNSADLLREMSVTTAQHATATAHLQAVLEAKVKTETVRSQSLVEENASLSTQLQESQQRYNVRESELQRALGSLRECEHMISKEVSEIYETKTANVSAQDNRLRRMNMEFDFELYPHFLSATTERRWLIGSDLRLAINNVLESPSVREAFAGAVRAAGAKGKSRGLIDGFNHCAANGELTALPGYNPEAIEKLKDHPITSVMSSLVLPRSPGDGSLFESDLEWQLSVAKFVEGSSYESHHMAESERSLLDVLDAYAERVALKKSSKGGGPVWGVGAAHQPRPERVLISTLYPAHESFLARVAKAIHRISCFLFLASGLKINMSKSKILGVHVDSDRVKEAALKLGCLNLKIPFLYLESMVGGSMSRLHKWDEVVERVKTRLSKWKIKSLSIGGRLTLLKSVLGSMTIFHMSIFKVPTGVLRTLESIRCHFFNGHALGSNKASWISWKKVLASKDKGGLGVSSLYALNRSLMFKWIWRFYTQGNSLWIRVIQAIYMEQCKIDADVKIGSRSCWLNIVHEAKALAHKGIDLHDFMRPSLECSFRRKQRGGVEQEQFENLVILMHDVSLSPMADRWSWTLENSKDFTVSSVRKWIDDKLIPEAGSKTRWVKYVPIKVNVNAWKMIRLITRWWDVHHEEFDDYDDWRNWIVNLRLPSKSKLMLEGVFYVMWWCLWSIRNKMIFEDKIPVKLTFMLEMTMNDSREASKPT
nr:RNA-directed DNA polymerase, eukaryota, reverse transcriptase zinc-binding domain protein [Tanacetum cinerariifolium]